MANSAKAYSNAEAYAYDEGYTNSEAYHNADAYNCNIVNEFHECAETNAHECNQFSSKPEQSQVAFASTIDHALRVKQ